MIADLSDPADPEHCPIHQWAIADRPRERLLQLGPTALGDVELIALLLGSGDRGRDALSVARALLQRIGGLRALAAADVSEIASERGIGPAKSALLLAAVELGRRIDASALARGAELTDPASAARCLRRRLHGLGHEVFVALFLDTRHRLIACEELFRGTIDGATVHMREVVRRALQLQAAALIVAHNHPSGVAEPSRQDVALTRRLGQALALVDIRLLDHFVVGDGEPVSLAERGLYQAAG